ncbi:glucose 1-dehydrogenase [Streptomyces sp. A7024]|uniref:Glucose 1-dehydrogenase n=1 Tax=Streptomyces coryli TaxID=1128680 RepID=A0A6G4UAL6_9ACTN|nr:glucose 1-dehydrogenase [Streptomyces coryli]NGN68367.1 glucose 1-dehydrogenase [Streptomyces coryli]
MGKLDGRVILITGAARGQGEQEARIFAEEGARVVLADVLDDEGEAIAKELGEDRARYLHLDVSQEDEWTAAVAAATDAFGKLDGLVNNAGILRFNSLVKTPLEEYQQVVAVNQVGVFLGMKHAAPRIIDAGGGTIVNTASYAGLAGMAGLTSYAATKAAILGMTRVAAMELSRKQIRVNAICPGAVDTPMSNPGDMEGLDDFYAKIVPLGRIGQPAEVAKMALFLSSDDSSYVTGQPFVIDGGWLSGISLD